MSQHFHPRHHTRRSPQPPAHVTVGGGAAAPTFSAVGLAGPSSSPPPAFVGTSSDQPSEPAHPYTHEASGYLDFTDEEEDPSHGHGHGYGNRQRVTIPEGDETEDTEPEDGPDGGAAGPGGVDGEEGEEEEEEEDAEGDDAASDTSSADYDPDADPEGFARRLDELAGLKEVGVREERAVRGGPVLGLLPGEKRGPLPVLPFDQFKRYITHVLDSTDWRYPPLNELDASTGPGYVSHPPTKMGGRKEQHQPHPIRVMGRSTVGRAVGEAPVAQVAGASADSDSESAGADIEGLPRLRQEVLSSLGVGY